MKHVKKIPVKKMEKKRRSAAQLSCPVMVTPSETANK
jgi:hypothetical protein